MSRAIINNFPLTAVSLRVFDDFEAISFPTVCLLGCLGMFYSFTLELLHRNVAII